MKRPTVVALYLPQYHPVPENDEWWGPGFTEWTNVTKALPLYPGHRQPSLPADLGFYDLRVPEVRLAQAQLARAYGVDAFCYYHYWFGNGRQLLERPFNEVLASGQPDLPFMLCWANQTWSGVWHGLTSRVLVEQQYPGRHDHEAHFAALLPAFQDPRYVRVDGKPVFKIYRPTELPDCRATLTLWRDMARAAGLQGIYFLATHSDAAFDPAICGFDAYVKVPRLQRRREWVPWSQPWTKLHNKWLDLRGRPSVLDYAGQLDNVVPPHGADWLIPCVLPNWDNTPRSGRRGLVVEGSTPALFREQVRRALELADARHADDAFIFVKSWNEWAEGNHMEPGAEFGHGYLNALRDELAAHAAGDTAALDRGVTFTGHRLNSTVGL